MSDTPIRELDGLACLESLAKQYQEEYGVSPFDLSHWDPSEPTVKSLLRYLKLPAPPLAMPYIYSDPARKPQVMERLGFSASRRTCSFVQAGTNATLLAAWWLKAMNVRRVLILCPAYFSVFYALEVMDVPYKRLYLHRRQEGWHLPVEEICADLGEAPELTALWFTNPIYCTGDYRSDVDVAFLETLLRLGIALVTDECLCLNGREIGGKFAWSDRFVGIYSPHKSVCVNAVKFAAVIADAKYEHFFDRWSDVLVGNLSASNYTAISHFTGDNFAEFLAAFVENVDLVRKNVLQIIENADSIETDKDSRGHYISCYAPQIPGAMGRDTEFLRNLVWETGALVTPGFTNHFPLDVGFSFRINLARGCPQFFSALQRTIKYLASMSAQFV